MRRSRIELRHINYLLAAADKGSFRQAGKYLGVEQSAISRRIREIEQEIGGSLFRRSAKGVTLTDLGSRFVASARRSAEQLDNAFAEARSAAGSRRYLEVGVFGPLTMAFLAKLFATFHQEYPGVRVRFSEAGSPELIESVRRGLIDVGVVAQAQPGRGYNLLPLWDEPVYAAFRSDDPLVQQQSLRWADLRDRHFLVTDSPTGACARRLLMSNGFGEFDGLLIEQLEVTRESLLQLVSNGHGIALATTAHVRLGLEGLVFRLIEDAVLPYSAAYSKGPAHRDVERLLALAKSLSERQ